MPLPRLLIIFYNLQTAHFTAQTFCTGISVLNHCLSWSKFVNTHLHHSSQWFNIHLYRQYCLHNHCTVKTVINKMKLKLAQSPHIIILQTLKYACYDLRLYFIELNKLHCAIFLFTYYAEIILFSVIENRQVN